MASMHLDFHYLFGCTQSNPTCICCKYKYINLNIKLVPLSLVWMLEMVLPPGLLSVPSVVELVAFVDVAVEGVRPINYL